MKQICNFSPEKDIVQHRPSLCIDINQVFDTMEMPSTGAFDVDFDNIDNTDSIGPRIENTFDAIEYGIALNENIRSQEYTSGTGNNTTPVIPSTSNGGAE